MTRAPWSLPRTLRAQKENVSKYLRSIFTECANLARPKVNQLGLVKCEDMADKDALVDLYIRPGDALKVIQHASIRNPQLVELQKTTMPILETWESKYNIMWERFTHNPGGVNGLNYGVPMHSFKRAPPKATTTEGVKVGVPAAGASGDANLDMKASVEPEAQPTISTTTSTLSTNFPVHTQLFTQRFAAWVATWEEKFAQSSWSDVVAQGKEFDALVTMGTSTGILPFVADKLSSKDNFAVVHLCECGKAHKFDSPTIKLTKEYQTTNFKPTPNSKSIRRI